MVSSFRILRFTAVGLCTDRAVHKYRTAAFGEEVQNFQERLCSVPRLQLHAGSLVIILTKVRLGNDLSLVVWLVKLHGSLIPGSPCNTKHAETTIYSGFSLFLAASLLLSDMLQVQCSVCNALAGLMGVDRLTCIHLEELA